MILTKQFLNQNVSDKLNEEFIEKRSLQQEIRKEYDIFISYSWNDKAFAFKVVYLLEQCGYSTYVDYKDKKLNRKNVTKNTAIYLTSEMKKCKVLLYLSSPSASVSKWCPWEVGYFSGIKDFKCANLPLIENYGDNFKNQEYLEIYPYIEYEKYSNKKVFDFWVCTNDETYVPLKKWINGIEPQKH